MRRAVEILNPWMGVVFAICVALQWNDPDPRWWMPMYGAAMMACILQGLSRLRAWMSAAIGLVALVWSATIVPRVVGKGGFGHMFESMKASDPLIEESREIGGLLIIVAWMAVLTISRIRSRRTGATAP